MAKTRKSAFQYDLDQLRKVRARVCSSQLPSHSDFERLCVNPTLEIVSSAWRGLAGLLDRKACTGQQLEPGPELVLVWKSPHDHQTYTEAARPADLAAIKIILEERDRHAAAREADVPVGAIDTAIRQAVSRGLLLSPPSRIRRPDSFSNAAINERYLTATVFTLQWHITRECDLNCLHCYDRSARSRVLLADGLKILDQMRAFCLSHYVQGQVSLSGGNPLLHPDFMTLYRAAAERGLATALLANPTSSRQVAEIVAVQMPAYFQVSLEGLEKHNDRIRGAGHFQRTLEFLDILADLKVPSEVMLTLTRENLDQILPLGELLRNRTSSLTFNRLALFGRGAALALPEKDDYVAFLSDYRAAMRDNPVLALKDSLFNCALERENQELFAGCAGYGCGAAFNFLALLPDGEVHACRKFPSAIGTVVTESLSEIYHSKTAAAYREGSSACQGCAQRAVCRGCPAVTASFGGDPFSDRDPFCFRQQ
ncbi:MAG: selenobiotic family peptide radical SAM maturase [Deltaproteobacteria bacterium]|nr:selenobiotic family peptide radical SAM maturase [Deltaproteobacteria bacterium]TLN01570.1 MAG: selenobiotic family peptide radical SAM maturase [bacterium]